MVDGTNELRIQVTNVWVNRLIGDAGLPEEKRLTKTHARRPPGETGRQAHLKGYKADDPLVPSGLLAPSKSSSADESRSSGQTRHKPHSHELVSWLDQIEGNRDIGSSRTP